MKLKHNKKRNTAFLYEVLVRHLTKSVLEGDLQKKKAVSSIIKKYFRKGTALREQLEIFRAVATKERLDYRLAEKILVEAKKRYASLNRERIFEEQSELIRKINQALSKEAYNVFIPNYKSIATIHQIFNNHAPIKTRIILEERVIHGLCLGGDSGFQKMEAIDNIVYKTFAKKFNKTYKDNLLEEQKMLLNRYIVSFADNGMDLKVFLSEEIRRLKTLIEIALKKEEIMSKSVISGKIKEVLRVVDGFKDKEVDQDMVEQVLKIQSLVKEI